MKLRLTYLLRNLLRNPVRTLLTCAAVGLPILIFILSVAAVDGIERFLQNSADQLRLAVTHKAGVAHNLPVGYRRRIESLDPGGAHIRSVCSIIWIGGRVQDVAQPLSTLAADADQFVATFPEYGLTPEQIDQWNRDRTALIVGSATAAQMNWKMGDRVIFQPSVPPYKPMEFRVVSTNRAPDPTTLWCRRDYWEASIKGSGAIEDYINFFFVKCGSKADVDRFTLAIDREFAGAPDETKTQDEKAFMNQFISQQFNLPRNLSILAGMTVFVAILAAANTMSMNFRDRIGEFAALRAMGFGGITIFGMVQAEAMLLCGLGGLVGALTPYVAFMYTPLKHVPLPLILSLTIREEVCVMGLLISMGIGVIAALWPAWLALRMRVVTALRSME